MFNNFEIYKHFRDGKTEGGKDKRKSRKLRKVYERDFFNFENDVGIKHSLNGPEDRDDGK